MQDSSRGSKSVGDQSRVPPSLDEADGVLFVRAESVLHEVLERAPVDRPGYLDRACAGDTALRREVEQLLVAATSAFDPLDQPIALNSPDGGIAPPEELSAGAALGPYRIIRSIGRGGMGEVFLAERADGQFEQQVAVKVMRRDAVEHVDRFHAERRILAQLQHPGIAHLIDGGVTPDGRPFMVMEFVPGISLTEYCTRRRLDLRARLALFDRVCDAVAFAHSRLVVHRDLKPANILVTEDHQVKLLDFGVAKLVRDHLAGDATVTQGAPLTPQHAAPEQLQGHPISTATDVYALGVVLFEVLTGRLPWSLHGMPVSVALRHLLHEDAPVLSETAAKLAEPPVPARLLKGDLDAIVSKALRKEVSARYTTVSALRRDLNHHVAGEPVSAGPDTLRYRIGKYLRRHRVGLSIGLATVTVLGAFSWQLALERDRALRSAATAEAVIQFLNKDLLARASPAEGATKDLTVRQLLDLASQRMDRFNDRPEVAAQLHSTLGEAYAQLDEMNLALEHFERAYETFSKLYGPTAEPAIESRLSQLSVLGAVGRGVESCKLADTLLAEVERAGVTDEVRLSVRAYALRCAYGEGRSLERALVETQAVVAEFEQLGLTQGMAYIGAIRDLAVAAFDAGRFHEAAVHHEKLVADANTRFGASHQRTAKRRAMWAGALMYSGDLVRADQELSRAIADQQAWVGDAAVDLGNLTLWQALLRIEQGRPVEAEELCRRLVDAGTQKAGTYLLSGKYALTEALLLQGRLDEARISADEVIAMSRKQELPRQWYELPASAMAADAMLQQDRIADAREYLAGVDVEAIAALDPSRRGLVQRALGWLAAREGAEAKAREALAASLEAYERQYGPTHWRTRRARQELAGLETG